MFLWPSPASAGAAIWVLTSFLLVGIFRNLLPPKEWSDIYGVAERLTLAIFLYIFTIHIGVKLRGVLTAWWRDKESHLRIFFRYFGVYAGSLALVVLALTAIFLLLEKTGTIDHSIIPQMSEESISGDSTTRLRVLFNTSTPRFILLLLSTCIIAPIIEEVFFRRFLYVALRKRFPFVPALAIATMAFMVVHPNIALGAIGGIYLGYVYEKGKSLPANIAIHSTVNFLVTSISLVL